MWARAIARCVVVARKCNSQFASPRPPAGLSPEDWRPPYTKHPKGGQRYIDSPALEAARTTKPLAMCALRQRGLTGEPHWEALRMQLHAGLPISGWPHAGVALWLWVEAVLRANCACSSGFARHSYRSQCPHGQRNAECKNIASISCGPTVGRLWRD